MGSSSDPIRRASAPLNLLVRHLDTALVGQDRAKRALLLAAVAELPIEFVGPPGCGKRLLLEAMPGAREGGAAGIRRGVSSTDPFRIREDCDRPPAAPRPVLSVQLRSLTQSNPEQARTLIDRVAEGARGTFGPRANGERLREELNRLRLERDRVGLSSAIRGQALERMRVCARHSSTGIRDSDLCALPRLLRAHALLRGADRVEDSDLELWGLGFPALAPPGVSDPRGAARRRDGQLPVHSGAIGRAAEPTSGSLTRAVGYGARSGCGEDLAARPVIRDRELSPLCPEDAAGALDPEAPPDQAIEAWLERFEGHLGARRGQRSVRARVDPAGAPRRLRPLRSLSELSDADPVQVCDYVSGRSGELPRVAERRRRPRLPGLVLIRDVSASMQGPAGRWCGRFGAALIALAARRKLPVGYIEFHHEAERFAVGDRFLHTDYAALAARIRTERCEGQTSFEAPLRALLERVPAAHAGQAILVTDGLPVVGDPEVREARRRLREAGWRVHGVFVGHGRVPGLLVCIARDTGGFCVRVRPRPGATFELEDLCR